MIEFITELLYICMHVMSKEFQAVRNENDDVQDNRRRLFLNKVRSQKTLITHTRRDIAEGTD